MFHLLPSRAQANSGGLRMKVVAVRRPCPFGKRNLEWGIDHTHLQARADRNPSASACSWSVKVTARRSSTFAAGCPPRTESLPVLRGLPGKSALIGPLYARLEKLSIDFWKVDQSLRRFLSGSVLQDSELI